MPEVRADARVIFVTAHDAFALRAFEVNALDYLLKPVKAERLASTLARVVAGDAAPASTAPTAASRLLKVDDIVQLNSGNSSRFVPVADLAAIEAQENYSLVYLVDGGRVLVRRTLKAWEERLGPAGFVRVHRTALVNLAHVSGYDREGAKVNLLQVKGVPALIPVGRAIWPEVKARLSQV